MTKHVNREEKMMIRAEINQVSNWQQGKKVDETQIFEKINTIAKTSLKLAWWNVPIISALR